MSSADPALVAASAKFPVVLGAVLERADPAQLRTFHAALERLAATLGPSEQRVLAAWTARLRSGLLH